MRTADAQPARKSDGSSARRVVYLLGAGATQGAASFAGSSKSLVMRGLADDLREGMRTAYEDYAAESSEHVGLKRLVNDVSESGADIEHLLTFLDDTPSRPYQRFADRLRKQFSDVLRNALESVREDTGDDHSLLYAVLIDMHQVKHSGESLAGFLTLNYDSFLEHAIEERHGLSVDYGIRLGNMPDASYAIPVLKLHGSFSWHHVWPLDFTATAEDARWIPPGIRKSKGDYPFNAIWGGARELLNCDLLRIIGCNLNPNDWDLVSLLFSTMHGREEAPPYDVELIGAPDAASEIAEAFPYLKLCPLLEINQIGEQLIAEILGGEPKTFDNLDETEQRRALDNAGSKITNPFEHWLRVKGELMLADSLDLETDAGAFRTFVEASA